MKTLAAVVFLLSFFVSPNLLYMAGLGYSSVGGSAIFKIHPMTYIFFVMYVVGFFVFHGSWAGEVVKKRTLTILIALVFLLLIYCILSGFSVANPAVTFLTPLTAYYVLQRTSFGFRSKLASYIRLVIALNAILGIYEALTGNFLLTRVAGDVLIQQDTRPMGFIGHPLPSAMMSGLLVIYISSRIAHTKVTLKGLAELLLHVAALLAFGGRLSLVTALILGVALFAFGGSAKTSGQRSQRIIRRVLVVLLVVGVIGFVANSEFAQATIDRFVSDDGASSTQTRFSALEMLQNLTPSEWFLGVSSARREALQSNLDSEFGIESTWISWIVTFGVIWALLLAFILIFLIFKHVRKANSGVLFMSIFYLIAISGAQGLGGKTLTLTWFLVMLLCFSVDSLKSVSLSKYLDANLQRSVL